MNVNLITDLELEATAERFHIACIQHEAPQTGSDDPGGIAWIWPFIAIPFVFKRNKYR